MTRSSSPCYFVSLMLENVKGFKGHQRLELLDPKGHPARWSLILGDNGLGKTTLLRCIARMRPIPGQSTATRNTDKDADILEASLLGDTENNDDFLSLARKGRGSTERRLSVKLAVQMAVNCSFEREVARAKTVQVEVNFEKHGSVIKNVRPEEISPKRGRFKTPFILAYGAGRHMGTRNTEVTATDPLASLFNPAIELFDADELLGRMDYGRALKQKNAASQLQKMKEVLATLLPEIDKAEDIVISGPNIPGQPHKDTGLLFRTPDGLIRFSEMSLGYQTVAAWAIDIAWRMFERFPKSDDPLSEHAIVLVDEIDLHLHPKWQRRMREDLTRHFPNVQFIATAHSPLMAQSSLDANLVVLQREDHDHVVIVNDPPVIQNWRLDQIVTSELFGLETARPPGIEQLIEKRSELGRKERLSTDDKRQLAEIDAKLSNLDVADNSRDREAMEIVRQAADVLRRRGASS